jgi:transcriptional regulator NrdR family protein
MAETWTTQVIKRDGTTEPFDLERLAGALWRGLYAVGGSLTDARQLAKAVALHLGRQKRTEVTSDELFEMMLKALRRVRFAEAAELLLLHRTLRTVRREQLQVRHHGDQLTRWDKSWLVSVAMELWPISHRMARIIAGEVEERLLVPDRTEVPREKVLALLNRKMCELGLADAVPVR